MRTARTMSLALSLALGLGLWGCAVMPSPVSEHAAPSRLGTARLTLVPQLTTERGAQAIVPKLTAASIARVDVVPYAETSPNVYQPLSRTTGLATTADDPDLLKGGQPGIELGQGILLTNLHRNTKYRIYARAYDAQGALISLDASSLVNVSITDNDAPSAVLLPLRLADTPFAARAEVLLLNGNKPNYAKVVTSLVTVSGSSETLVGGTTQTLTKAQIPMTVRLDGLKSQTTYRLKASIQDAGGTQLATASADIAVTNDYAPASQSIAISLPPLKQVSTVAGTAGSTGLVNGTGTNAKFWLPVDLKFDTAGNLYVADCSNNAIRKITSAGVVTTLAGGNATKAMADGIGTAAKFSQPRYLAFDTSGTLYVADSNNNAIRKINVTTQQVTTLIASPAQGFVDGIGAVARFDGPSGLAFDKAGALYFSDSLNNAIRKINLSTLEVTTVAGDGTQGNTNGIGTSARFNSPGAIVFDKADNLYVSDGGNYAIRKIDLATREVSTFAGGNNPLLYGFFDGTGTNARFLTVGGLAFDAEGNLYVADGGNHAIRKITPAGVVATYVGPYPTKASGYVDGAFAVARFNHPGGLVIDASGDLYVSEQVNHTIRKVQ